MNITSRKFRHEMKLQFMLPEGGDKIQSEHGNSIRGPLKKICQ
eukprot:CAMPEP_0195297650 /NCGR_PEP_ID=MMETSP0707-20130614/21938_1 /TAXON_ID=33640 /ORGANISM="Asterionellopsis glacialis, Strain CCMP134" /LENGTH=42 /DNA_ID= /DNA_START= /DNA_END= /DNA_ORIENTATION=